MKLTITFIYIIAISQTVSFYLIAFSKKLIFAFYV